MNKTIQRANGRRFWSGALAIAVLIGIFVLLGLLYWRWDITGKSVLLLGFMLLGTYLAGLFQIIFSMKDDRVRSRLFPAGSIESVLSKATRKKLVTLRYTKKFDDADRYVRGIFLGFAAMAACGAVVTGVLGNIVATAILGAVSLLIILLFGRGASSRDK